MFESQICKTRDNKLDFFKGIAAISFIFIHTVFWSGAHYVPSTVQTLSLLFDVPILFFLAGWAAAYAPSFKRTVLSLLRTHERYAVFCIFHFLILWVIAVIFGVQEGLTLSNFYAHLFLRNYENDALYVVMGSVWFLSIYYTVSTVGSFLLSRIRKASQGSEGEYRKWLRILLCLAVLALLYSYFNGYTFLTLSTTHYFHLVFFFLGVLCYNAEIKRTSTLVILLLVVSSCMCFIGNYTNVDMSIMQNHKFPPDAIYLFYSLISVIVVLWLKSRISNISEKNVFCKIGRSAFSFYLCQGISSSIICYIAPYINTAWFLKLPLMFLMNLAMAVLFVVILNQIYKLWDHLRSKLAAVLAKNREAV